MATKYKSRKDMDYLMGEEFDYIMQICKYIHVDYDTLLRYMRYRFTRLGEV